MNIRDRFQIRLIYALCWTVGSILLGILLAPIVTSPPLEDHSTHALHDHSKAHGKIEVDPGRPQVIKTVRGIGYVFCTGPG